MSEEEKIDQSTDDSPQSTEKNISEPSTINYQPSTNMEVHHHPNVEKKKFREYFLEFLMIFLAVTMGFFAENIREYFAEKKTVKEYLENFQDELKQNEASIHYCDSIFTLILPAEDSIVNIFFEKKEN